MIGSVGPEERSRLANIAAAPVLEWQPVLVAG